MATSTILTGVLGSLVLLVLALIYRTGSRARRRRGPADADYTTAVYAGDAGESCASSTADSGGCDGGGGGGGD